MRASKRALRGGSRGKGALVTAASDWDVYLVVREPPKAGGTSDVIDGWEPDLELMRG